MKIIIANYRYFIAGGPEKYMFKFMEAAAQRGIEVIPFSVANPQNENSEYSEYFAKPRADALMYTDTRKTIGNLIGVIRATVWNYDAAYRLRRLIRATKPDAVYILHEINHLSPSIIRAAGKEGVRVVHRISDFFMFCAKYDFLCENEICEACIQGDYRKAIQKRCMKGSHLGTYLRIFAMKLYWRIGVFEEVDHYITTCHFTKHKLVEGGIDARKISCVPTFIDSSLLEPCYEDEKYFLFLGRMAVQKGTIYAVQAMEYLKDTEYVLKVTGTVSDSEEDQKLWQYIVDHQLEDKVIFTGFLRGKELEALISRATCIVCPSIWYENMPNTVIEAYAYGKPVVASAIGSLEEVVADDVTGYLFERKNAENLAEKLRKFVCKEGLAKELGVKARKVCEEQYGVDRHMDDVIRILKGE